MNIQRIVFVVVLLLQGACVTAAQQNIVPTWTPFLALAGSVLLALMNSIKGPPAPPAGPSKLPAILLVLGALALAGSVSACAAFQKAMPFLPTPGDLACVATDVEKNVTNPIQIVSDCPGLAQTAIADIEALVVNLVMAKKAAHKAAAEHAAETCDGGADAGK